MTKFKLFNLILTIMVVFSMLAVNSSQVIAQGADAPPQSVTAMPINPTDETKVPHSFGPYPNWANSPFTLPDAQVSITGDGTGAIANAVVGGNGAITGFTITSPGSGYTTASVNITSATGTGASASAVVSTTGSVTAIAVNTAGTGYTAPTVAISGGGPIGVPPTILPAPSTRYSVNVGSATGGSFTLTVGAATTTTLPWNASAVSVQAALSAAGVGTNSITGTGSIADPWIINFSVPQASVIVDAAGLTQGVADASAVPGIAPVVYNVTVGSATGGSFTLSVDAATTASIAWNALAADVQAALATAGVSSVVTGSGSIASPWVITFTVAPTTVSINPAGLTMGVVDASALVGATSDVYNVTVGSATGGSFALDVDGLLTGAISWNALAADVQAALAAAGISTVSVTGSGSSIDPWVITFTVAPTLVTPNFALLTQGVGDASANLGTSPVVYNVHVGSATGGLFQLTVDAATTAPILWNALAADVQAALAAAGVTTSVTGSGSVADPWVISFAVAPTTITPNFAGLTQGVLDTSSTLLVTDAYLLDLGTAYGGTFTLSVDAVTTAPIAWNALPADIQTALALISVTASVTGVAPSFTIVFAVPPTTFTVDSTALIQPPSVGATATAYGAVEAVVLDNPGAGYKYPTVDFDMPTDPNGVQAQGHVLCAELNCQPAVPGDPVTITGVQVDNPGSGYTVAPGVTIRDGTIFDPTPGGGSGALAHSTLYITTVGVDTFGSGYTSVPSVLINDPTGTGASATATVDIGAITAIDLVAGGINYLTQGGIKKFQDGLPVLCIPTANFSECAASANGLGQYIPIAIPDTTTFTLANGFAADADYYVIALVQHRERMSSSLPATGSLLREYVQLETAANAGFSKHVALTNELVNGTSVPALMPDGSQAYALDDPHYLGPIIVANKDKPVRIVFYNLLPTGSDGNLFLPADTTIMGSGMGPMDMPAAMDLGTVMDEVRNPICTDNPQATDPMTGMALCFKQNRATIHLHGGTTPWISDGTAHQWITPANENTPWPQGVAVGSVPDMARPDLGVPDCTGTSDGCSTFYYTNQQSARLMFYHDHMWGMTRLNVYAGVAAGYVLTDATEQALFGPTGPYASMGEGIPLVIQDKTFVPEAAQVAIQDPTWDYTRWGGYGNLWYHHVYMSAQNPGDPGGMSAYGRWMYGPWFWPPATPQHGPIANPYYNMDPLGPDGIRYTADDFTTPLAVPCNLDDPATWQYDTDPFCEPQYIPGTPNISAGMEQFNDTPLVNGTAYPTVTLDPKSYRFRILNAANDRFWNLQWYIADPRTGTDSEVALNPAEVAAAQLDPVVFPTALQSIIFNGLPYNLAGPDWIAIGSEGGFLPAPVVVDGQQVTTWITDPTRFDVGNVDLHSLLLAPAERADVIVDFSQFAGKTLILYNDAPAAFPARVPSYDYYTGYPDQFPNGPSAILPGYGPNTRTIMQVRITATTPAAPFNLTALQNAFKHHADGSGVFESSQHPIIVGQSDYNSAYGTNFASSSWCNAPGAPTNRCDGFARISDQGGMALGFNTLLSPNTRVEIPIQPKAIHDEMNAVAFDEYGRMTANIGLEAVPANPAAQNVILYPFVNPPTELIDATNLPYADVEVTPISNMADGTQIWKITHNGVDTHPIHWHMYDVQVLNRVTWDNIIIKNDPTELGWKDTVRISPLQDTIVALRPVVPAVPWELPNSIRPLNPMMPAGSTAMFNPMDPQGNPTAPIINQLVNFGWEYTYHCHILSHEEMDMMRPVSVALPPIAPDGLLARVVSQRKNVATIVLTWNDNSIAETGFAIERSDDGGVTWTQVGIVDSPLDQPNTKGVRTYTETADATLTYQYRVMALNTVGFVDKLGGVLGFPTITTKSAYTPPATAVVVPAEPTNLAATLLANPARVSLTWTDNSTIETGFIIEVSTNGGAFTQLVTLPPRNNTGGMTYVDSTVVLGNTYTYRVAAFNANGLSLYSNTVTITVDIPTAPSDLIAIPVRSGNNERVALSWTDNANNESGFTLQRSATSDFAIIASSVNLGPNSTTYITGNIPRQVWYFRIRANNVLGSSVWVTTGGIQPAFEAHSPLVFMSSFNLGLSNWSGQEGEVETEGRWLIADWGNDDPEETVGQPAYVYHDLADPLGSFMGVFEFNPNGAATSDIPVDIYSGVDADGSEIFGLQYLHTTSAPGSYQIRAWAKTEMVDITTDWVSISNAQHTLQLDWQSAETSSLNMYVDGQDPVSVWGDTSLYQLARERLGPSLGVDSISLSPSDTPKPVSFAEYFALSTQIVTPYTPIYTFTFFLPQINR